MTQNHETVVVIGIDVSKHKFDVALLRNEKLRHKSFPNTSAGHEALLVWLRELGVTSAHACLESTNVYGEALAERLHDHGHTD